MQAIREALAEVEEMADIVPSVEWTWEDVAYQEIGDHFSLLWGDE